MLKTNMTIKRVSRIYGGIYGGDVMRKDVMSIFSSISPRLVKC